MSNIIFDIKEGLTNSEEITVNYDDTAIKYGSGTVEVLSTPAMIGLMEKVAMNCVATLIPEGFITLGTEVNIRHIKATPVGMKVRCEARLLETEGRKLTFEVSAWDEIAQIGIGIHKRYIVNHNEFMNKITKGTK